MNGRSDRLGSPPTRTLPEGVIVDLFQWFEGLSQDDVALIDRFVESLPERWERAAQGKETLRLGDVLREMGSLGLLGMRYDPAYGGAGLDTIANAIFAEELGRSTYGGFAVTVALGAGSSRLRALSHALAYLAGKAMTYATYLKVDALLSLQQPQSAPAEHDESLFIVIHQVYELWFKLIIRSIRLARDHLAFPDRRLGDDAAHTQDRALRQVDDRGEGVNTIGTQIGDSEGAASQLLGSQLPRPGREHLAHAHAGVPVPLEARRLNLHARHVLGQHLQSILQPIKYVCQQHRLLF